MLKENSKNLPRWDVAGGLVFYRQMIALVRKTKDFYGKNHSLISSVYDAHHGLRWNGGRRERAPASWSLDESIRRVKEYNKLGVPFNIAFNNILLKKKHLNDKYCNYFLKGVHNKMNGIIVASDLLKDYLRKNYPELKLIASICFCEKKIENYRRMFREYDMVVLHPDLNRNFNFIQKINPADRSRLKILVNEECVPNCRFRKKHNETISRQALNGEFGEKYYFNVCIPRRKKINFKGYEMILTVEEMRKLISLGIRNFKIQGRQRSFNYVAKFLKDYTMSLISPVCPEQ